MPNARVGGWADWMADARRGLALHERGYVVIRPNYQQAESQRAEVVAAVRAAVRATGTVVRSRRRAARS